MPGYASTAPLPPIKAPSDGAELVIWLVQNADADPWLPTRDEQDERWRELYGDRAERLRRQQRAWGHVVVNDGTY